MMRQTLILTKSADEFSLSGEFVLKITPLEKQLFLNEEIKIDDESFKMYRKIIYHHIIYTSEKFKNVSTIDYFVRLRNGAIGSINYFVVVESDLFAMITLYEILGEFAHFKKIKRSSNQKCLKMNEISTKMLYIKFGPNEFVTVLANNYEKT